MKVPLRRIDHVTYGELPSGPVIAACSGDSLVMVNESGELLLEHAFGTPITAAPLLFDLGTGTAVGVVCGASHELHLIEMNSARTPGSPFDGNTPFSIADLDRDGEWELVAGDRKGRLVVHKLGEAAALP